MRAVDQAINRWFRVTPISHVRPPGAAFDPGSYYDSFAGATLEILQRWADALTGLEDYSHLLVIFWFDRARRARKPRLQVLEGRGAT